MHTRRTVVVSLAGIFAVIGSSSAPRAEGAPTAKLIPGEPSILDYGDGVKVPCNKTAFFTLWESSTFWLTFGFGISPSLDAAAAQAGTQASGVMKFLLLTLAFAPERLIKVDGNGWRKKDPNARDFVLGELQLPGSPGKAVSDVFLGGGNTEISPFWNWSNGGSGFPAPLGQSTLGPPAPPSNMRRTDQHAFSSYVVMKKDLGLDDVRKRATILQL